MTDPFEKLRGSTTDVVAPSVADIRTRAHRIQRRRYVTLASSAAIVALVAGVGLFVRLGPSSQPKMQAGSQQSASTESGSALTGEAAPKALAPTAQPQSGAGGSAGRTVSGSATQGYGATTGQAGQTTALSPQPPIDVTLIVKKRSIGRGDDLTLKACNPSSASVSWQFRTSQRFDFRVSRNGSEVWRWSNGK